MGHAFDRDARRARVASPGLLALALVGVAAVLAGCSELDVGRAWPWPTSKADKPQAVRTTLAGTHATQSESGRDVRGFRGRIFFYPKEKPAAAARQAPDSQKPMKVEGTLTVYAFEVLADGKLSPAAPRRWLFVPDKLKKQ